ncbi:MAG: HemK family protein methyltransferase [Patescibacteria group bacterium]
MNKVLIKNIIYKKLATLILKKEIKIGDSIILQKTESDLLDHYLSKIEDGYPLDYITGEIELENVRITIREGVFIPRPCTETLIQFASNLIIKYNLKNVLDICSGSGFIGISLAKRFKNCSITQIEISTLAFEINKTNIYLNELKNVQLLNTDALKLDYRAFKEDSFLICNPPYVPLEFHKSVMYEPTEAIYSGVTGLTFFEEFIRILPNKFPTHILFELDPRNIKQAQALLSKNFLTEIVNDDEGFERFLYGKRILY